MDIRLTWVDPNYGESEQRVYRSTSSFDSESLPTVHATLDPNVNEYLDVGVTEGLTYFYIVSAVVNGVEYFSDLFEIIAQLDYPVDSLVMFHNMENLTGSVLEDAFGTFDGTVFGAVQDTGISGQCLAFDGNDRVEINDNAALDFGNVDFSISLWVRLNTLGNNRAMLTKTTAFSDAALNYAMDQSSINGWRFRVTSGASGAAQSLVSYATGVWVHLVGVYKTGRTAELWINGELENSLTVSADPSPNSGKLYLGSYFTSSGMDGDLDQVRIYSKALDSIEIASLYSEGSP